MFTRRKLESMTEASSVAQEAVSNIRTTQAFALKEKLINVYESISRAAQAAGQDIGRCQALGFASLYFVIYAEYALGFWFGARLAMSGKGLRRSLRFLVGTDTAG